MTIAVTYAGADALLDSSSFGNLITTLSHHLPLRNIHWRPSHSQSIRTIQSLDVRLEPISDTLLRNKLKPETRHLVQSSLLERPFCHLYFVVCDDNDAYRHHVRNGIRTWLATLQASPTISAASVVAAARSSTASLQQGQGADVGAERPGTPPVVVKDSNKDTSTGDDSEKAIPEHLIVLVSPPEGSNMPASAGTPGAAAAGVARGGSPAPSAASGASAASGTGEVAEKKTGLGRFYSASSSSSTKGNVLDKIKTDFKANRVVHLNRLPNLAHPPSSHSDPTVFADLLSRLKESVSMTFDSVIEAQSDVVRREANKRTVPGWNFCKWMAEIECVASTLEATGLHADALARYDEIDSTFEQCMRDRSLAFFPSVGGSGPGDDSAPLLDVSKKPYRQLILRNEISLFDFRCYVFAKRANLMGKLGRVAQVMNDAPGFLASVAHMLEGESLPRHFIESWTFSSALDIVEQCQAWLVERGDMSLLSGEVSDDAPSAASESTQSLSAAFHASKASLLDLARRQLDKIGMSEGHLPRAYPFLLSSPLEVSRRSRDLPPLPSDAQTDSDVSAEEKGKGGKKGKVARISRQELLDAIDNRHLFDLHYVALTERVIAGCISAGRRRNVLRLRGVLASLDFHRERYQEAFATFTSLAEPYAEARLGRVEASHLAKQLACHAKLGKPHDRAWVSVVVALLKTRAGQSQQCGVEEEEEAVREYLDEDNLFKLLRDHTRQLGQEVPVSQFDLLSIAPIESLARRIHTEDGSLLKVQVRCDTASALEVDDVRMCLSSGQRDQLWLTSGKMTLHPGINEVQIQTSAPAPGKYVVDVSQIRIAHVIFQYSYPRGPLDATFIDVPLDGEALDASMELPRSIKLDQPRQVLLKIETGRNDVLKASIRIGLVDAQNRPMRGLSAASTEAEHSFDEAAQTLTLSNLSKGQVLVIDVPLQEGPTSADGLLKLSLAVDYWTTNARSEVRRQLRKRAMLAIGLPLGVNVQDFFRRRSLVSKFSISAGHGSSLRLGAVRLTVDGGNEEEERKGQLEILSPPSGARDTVVSAQEPASYVFCIGRRKDGKGDKAQDAALWKKGGGGDLRLRLAYRTLQEEAKEVVLNILRKEIEAAPIEDAHVQKCLERFVAGSVERQIDTATYEKTNRVILLGNDAVKAARKEMRTRWGIADTKQEDAILALIRSTLAKAASLGSDATKKADLDWRSLELVVEVPSMDVVCAASILPPSKDAGPFVIGKPIEAKLRVRTSFNWRRASLAGESLGAGAEAEEEDDFTKTPRGGKMLELAPTMSRSKSATSDEDKHDEDDDFHDAHSRAPSPLKRDHHPPQSLRLLYDIGADFEHWLVSGKKRCAFDVSAQQEEEKLFDVVLIPAKTGHLLFPSVSIWPIAPAPKETPPSLVHARQNGMNGLIQQQQQQQPLPTCETYVENAAQTVFVVPDPHETRRRYWLPSTMTAPPFAAYEQGHGDPYESARQQSAFA